MESKRENNYDLLRIICSLAIISTHVSAMYVNAITQKGILGEYYYNSIEITVAYNVLSRFAVPCFLMLSGAFLLTDIQNAEYKYFYKKSFYKIGIPTLVFSAFYFLYTFVRQITYISAQNSDSAELLLPLEELLKGRPYYHMWYMYMLFIVFVFVPIIIRLKKDIGEKVFEKVAWIFLVLACFSASTSTHELDWDIGQAFCYLGYFMIGYVIRKKTIDRKNNRKGILLLGAGLIVGLFATYIRYVQIMENKYSEYEFIGSYSPLMLLMSLFIFAGMLMMVIKTDFRKLSFLTFLIYLLHAAVWDFIAGILIMIFGVRADSKVIIPMSIILVFIISAFLAKLYICVCNRLEKK